MGIIIRGKFPNFDRAAAKAEVGVEAAIVKAAADVVKDARNRVPVKSGALRNSISASIKGNKATIGPTAFYGRFVEFGTAKMEPQPFLLPAAEAVEPQLVEYVRKAGEGAIDA